MGWFKESSDVVEFLILSSTTAFKAILADGYELEMDADLVWPRTYVGFVGDGVDEESVEMLGLGLLLTVDVTFGMAIAFANDEDVEGCEYIWVMLVDE